MFLKPLNPLLILSSDPPKITSLTDGRYSPQLIPDFSSLDIDLLTFSSLLLPGPLLVNR